MLYNIVLNEVVFILKGRAPITPLQVDLSSNGGLFFERHHSGLQEVFDIVGLPEKAGTSLGAAVNLTQPWIKGDHSRPGYSFDIKLHEHDRLQELYAGFGQRQELMLPSGRYDEIILLGGMQAGNCRRLELLNRALTEHGVEPKRVSLLGGQRLLQPEKEKSEIESGLQQIVERSDSETWAAKMQSRHVAELSETDGIRIAATQALGSLTLRRIDLRFDRPPTPEGPDHLKGYELEWNNIPVSLMHTLAVDRPQGERRHTTEACVEDWLQRRQPRQHARIGFIAANPHIERMGRATARMLREAGRPDLELVVGGSVAADNLSHNYYLGEIARLLYEDQQDSRLAHP